MAEQEQHPLGGLPETDLSDPRFEVIASEIFRTAGLTADDTWAVSRIYGLPPQASLDVLFAIIGRIPVGDLELAIGSGIVQAAGGDLAQYNQAQLRWAGRKAAEWIVGKFKDLACWLKEHNVADMIAQAGADKFAGALANAGFLASVKLAILAAFPAVGPGTAFIVACAVVALGSSALERICGKEQTTAVPVIQKEQVPTLAFTARPGAVIRSAADKTAPVVKTLEDKELVNTLAVPIGKHDPSLVWFQVIDGKCNVVGYVAQSDLAQLFTL